ncbi:12274_t:CDS:2 [Gigaspora margarita]|uniref:12274_t:CDS:1 n=1 Tax=Gigaspora margarita TaxID=4874 RepID=A0ABN7UI52_GIGMA|nr:12274_t:CDS:2 [Gigaspora margarita]
MDTSVITSYLNNQNDHTNYSYRSFLKIYEKTIIVSSPPSNDRLNLDNVWAGAFLKKAKGLLDFADLKRKVESERAGKGLETYWQKILDTRGKNAALEDLKSSIIAMHNLPEMEKNGALTIMCNVPKHTPVICVEKINHFRNGVSERYMILYGLGNEQDPQLSALSLLNCRYVKLEAISALFEDKLVIRTEKHISGPNGHRPVDFALVSSQTSEVICVIEVKAKDFLQGVAQNTVQCESVLMKGRKNVLGIITDSEKWYFLKCSLGSDGKPNFSLSRPLVIVYGDDDMEKRVKEVLGHIVWLLNDVQNLGENSS